VGILNRISTITRSNINAMLDQAEDPEKMLDQLTRDMASGIQQARVEVAKMIADEKELQANAERSQQLADDWQSKAELAVKKGAEDLAREALRRKIDYGNNAKVYQSQWNRSTRPSKRPSRISTISRRVRGRGPQPRGTPGPPSPRQGAAAGRQSRGFSVGIRPLQRAQPDGGEDPPRRGARRRRDRALNDTTEDRFAKLGKDSELEDALLELKPRYCPRPSFLRRARLNQRTRALRRRWRERCWRHGGVVTIRSIERSCQG